MILYFVYLQSYHVEKLTDEQIAGELFCLFLYAINNGHAVIPMFVDMSAAFDTIDHAILLQWLNTHLFRIIDNVLAWFYSYLQNRKQSVSLLGTSSSQRDLKYGLLQGSILGPYFFSLYTLQVVIDTTAVTDTTADALVASSRHRLTFELPPLWVRNYLILHSVTVRNLIITFDTNMAMAKQIMYVIRQSFLSLRMLRDMCKVHVCLPTDVTDSLVHSCVSSMLDYSTRSISDCLRSRLRGTNVYRILMPTVLLTLVNMIILNPNLTEPSLAPSGPVHSLSTSLNHIQVIIWTHTCIS